MHPKFKIFALRALSHDHGDISVSMKQLVKLLQENRREAAKIFWVHFDGFSPRSGEIFFEGILMDFRREAANFFFEGVFCTQTEK